MPWVKVWQDFIVITYVYLNIIPFKHTRLLLSAACSSPASQSNGDPFGLCRQLHILQQQSQLHGSLTRYSPECLQWWLRNRLCSPGLYSPWTSFQSCACGLKIFSLLFPSESLTSISFCFPKSNKSWVLWLLPKGGDLLFWWEPPSGQALS